jgi:hypothetical protein
MTAADLEHSHTANPTGAQVVERAVGFLQVIGLEGGDLAHVDPRADDLVRSRGLSITIARILRSSPIGGDAFRPGRG